MANPQSFQVEILLFTQRNSSQILKAGDEIAAQIQTEFEPEALTLTQDSFEGSQAEFVKKLALTAPGRSLVLTIGGTGIGPEDFVPEATIEVCERLLPGIPELMRSQGASSTSKAWLSRYQCGLIGSCLILNLPGRPSSALESYQAAKELIFHIMKKIRKCH